MSFWPVAMRDFRVWDWLTPIGLLILPYRCMAMPSSGGALILTPSSRFSTDDLGYIYIGLSL